MFPKSQDNLAMNNRLAPTPPSTAQDTVETVVGPSVHVEGDFASEGNILVKGTVSGNVTTSRLLTVEEGAQIFANIKAGDAHISGHIKGNLRVSDRLELMETAQVLGDISCKVLVVSAGALIQGKVNMNGISIEDPKDTKSEGKRIFKTKGKTARAQELAEEEEA